MPHPELFAPPPTSPDYSNTAGEYACGQEHGATTWLNLDAVQEAIHVRKTDFQFSTGLTYEKNWGSLLEEYKTKLLPNFRILQYSGDADPCVPHTGTKRWIDHLKLPVEEPWHPWTPADGSMIAGYTQVYAGDGIGSTFTYTTIRNAGHMVPRYKPSEALHMFKRYLNDSPMEKESHAAKSVV